MASDLPRRIRRAARKFGRERVEYLEFLADDFEDRGGDQLLLKRFQKDARRYAGRPRGVLSTHWANRFTSSGGDFAAIFDGTLPPSEVGVISAVAREGGQALGQTIRELAAISKLISDTRSAVISILFGAAFAAVVTMAMVFGFLPYVLVPSMLDAIPDQVPTYLYGPALSALIWIADMSKALTPLVIALLFLLAAAVKAMPRWTGELRQSVDRWPLWRLYRDMAALKCLGLLAVLIQPRAGGQTSLKHALEAQLHPQTPWVNWHIQRMVGLVAVDGIPDTEAFRTGLFDDETRHLIADTVESHGMAEGLRRVRSRLDRRVAERVIRQAKQLRLGMLIVTVAVMIILFGLNFIARMDLAALSNIPF